VDTVNPTQLPTIPAGDATPANTTSVDAARGDAADVERVPVELTPGDVLRAAALYLERHGWTQWLYFDRTTTDSPFPPACMLGGIRAAVFGGTDGHATDSVGYDHPDAVLIRATQQHLAVYLDPEFAFNIERISGATDVIGDWNDAAERNAATVITALRDAADDWDRIHGGAR
jgi:hypothetical protein